MVVLLVYYQSTVDTGGFVQYFNIHESGRSAKVPEGRPLHERSMDSNMTWLWLKTRGLASLPPQIYGNFLVLARNVYLLPNSGI